VSRVEGTGKVKIVYRGSSHRHHKRSLLECYSVSILSPVEALRCTYTQNNVPLISFSGTALMTGKEQLILPKRRQSRYRRTSSQVILSSDKVDLKLLSPIERAFKFPELG